MARRDYLEKEVPWCTVILCTLCMICHLLVLDGNLATAASINDVGLSSKGWSNLGLDMAATFGEEIDQVMSNLTEQLNDGIVQIIAMEEMLDFVIATMGDETEKSLLQIHDVNQKRLQLQQKQDPEASNDTNETDIGAMAQDAIDNSPVPLPDGLQNIIKAAAGAMGAFADSDGDPMAAIQSILELLMDSMMVQLDDALDMFLDIMEPALMKVGEWFVKFGDKVQAGIETFSTTIDAVEKLLDQIMAQSGAGGEGAEDMEYNTYNLFAVSNAEVGISVQDLQDVAQIYEITALQGAKSEEIHGKYDANQDAVLDTDEFHLFTADPTLPGVMAIVLRSYAKKLAQVAGQVGGAKLRDEVANGVVSYLQLVAAKNMTKVEWIADRLTNESVPLAFSACVMRNLAMAADDPEVLASVDVGSVIIGVMSSINGDQTIAAADLMSSTEFWADEGFDPADQPACVDKVSAWTAAALIQIGSWPTLKKFHQAIGLIEEEPTRHVSLLETGKTTDSSKVIAMTGAFARAKAERSRHEYYRKRSERLQERTERLKSTATSRYLFDSLLGGQVALADDPMTTAAINSGTPAVPETLEFARYLLYNATDSAAMWTAMCFTYSGMSSTPADSFATQIEGMVKKTQGFMNMIGEYAGPEGIDRLRNKTHGFVEDAKGQLIDVIMGQLNKSADSKGSLLQVDSESGGLFMLAFDADSIQPVPDTGAWLGMVNMLQQVQAILPPAIENLKVARKTVTQVQKTLDNIFTSFLEQGLPVFALIATYYTYIWVAYFLLLSIFTLGIMYYGFWASGYCGGPKAYRDDDYVPPETCCDRLKCLCSSCYTACCKCCSGECVFWSCLLLGQLFVLVIFIVSLVLTLIAGIEMFVASGCAAIYVLGDEKVCTETMKMIQGWITTFAAGAPDLEIGQVCVSHSLMTCAVITNKLKTAAIYTIGGAITASVLSFQLLIESAILHERARMRRIIDGLLQDEAAEKADPADPATTA